MTSGFNICLVSDDAVPAATGVGTHVQLIARTLVERGHRVSIITTRRSGEPAVDEWCGVRLHRVFTLKIYGFYQALPSIRTIERLLREEAIDVVHYHYVGVMMQRVSKVASALGLPQISTFHFSAEVLTQPLVMRPFRAIIRRQMVAHNNRCNAVISPSKSLVSKLKEDGVSTPIEYISNPIGFCDSEAISPAARTRQFIVLYAGRLGPEKNLPLLLKAFRRFSDKFPDTELWVAGRGPLGDALEGEAAQLGIGQSVRFLGFVEPAELAAYYRACDVFVLPSVVEAQPLVVLEAMWFSRPVIVTEAIVAATELVADGENGFIVSPTDPAVLAERLEVLAMDSGLRAAMGAAGRRQAEEYRPQLVVDKLEAVYSKAIGVAGKADGEFQRAL